MSGRKWTDEEIEYLGYVAGKQSYKTIAKILNRSEESVKHKVYTLDLQEKISFDRKAWTDEEIEYLRKSYRKKSVRYIADKLHRTESSVKHAADRYGIIDANPDGISLNTIAKAFDSDLSMIKRWVNKYNMPVSKKKIGKGIYYYTNGEDFWKWAVKHKDIVPIKRYKKLSILPEPDDVFKIEDWVDKPYNHRKPVTKTEIDFIITLKKNGMTRKDIAKRIGRTEMALKHILRKYL